MKVTVEEEVLAGLVALAQGWAPGHPAVAGGLGALTDARRHRDHPGGRLTMSETGVLMLEMPTDAAESRWAAVAPAIWSLTQVANADPLTTHHADNLGAYTRDVLHNFGLSVTDEDTLFVVLVTASLLVQMAHNGYHVGDVPAEVLAGVAHIAQSLTIALIPFLPPEAKP